MVTEAQDSQQPGWLVRATEGERLVLRAGGVWVVAMIAELDPLVAESDDNVTFSNVQIDLSEVSQLDTSGAMLFYRVAKAFETQGAKVEYVGVSESHQPLLKLVEAAEREPHDVELPPENTFVLMVERVGKSVFEALAEGTALLNFFGMTIVKLLQAFRSPRRLRFVSLVHQIEQTGLNAVPIVALLSFLIGLSGGRSAAPVWCRDIHREPVGGFGFAGDWCSIDGDNGRRTFGLRLYCSDRHDEGQRRGRCDADVGPRSSRGLGAAKSKRVTDHIAIARLHCRFVRPSWRCGYVAFLTRPQHRAVYAAAGRSCIAQEFSRRHGEGASLCILDCDGWLLRGVTCFR